MRARSPWTSRRGGARAVAAAAAARPRGVARFAAAAIGAATVLCAPPRAAAGLGAGVAGTLDPETYREPADAEYWSCPAPPCDAPRIAAADLTREEFERRIMDGQVFVVKDIGKDWPMTNWDCDFFRNDAVFGKAEMMQHYAQSGSSFVGFQSDWLKSKASSGAKDQSAPKVAPFYWGIKDVQHADAQRSKTWKRAMLEKVQEHIRLPQFMDPGNLRDFHTTPEFWFAGEGAGAKAHIDSHVQATMSIQLAGTKRWRVGFMAPRLAPCLAMTYGDGDVYEGQAAWQPTFVVTLQPGEALFFPPGFIHETLNMDEGDGSCTASVTFQFASPMASRLYRRFLPRVRRTADIHEAWPLIARWASLHTSGDRSVPKAWQTYPEAREEALSNQGVGAAFRRLDTGGDGALSSGELDAAFGAREGRSLLAFHDLDDDGLIAREEFAEVYAFWSATTTSAFNAMPKKYARYFLEDMVGDFNIEDLPRRLQLEMLKVFQKTERSMRKSQHEHSSAGLAEGEL